ncbi:MAG: helix-turn-helix domain-containing protein [Acidimicrobiia bacterium]|nr:helix-turn-helix domain-containing protein [Acidimicrobiia bacterium]
MPSETLGDVIRARRDELGLTETRLAELLGVSPGTLRDWERDKRRPAMETDRTALAAVLGVGSDLFNSDSPSDSPDHLATPEPAYNSEGASRGRRLRLDSEPKDVDDEEHSGDDENPIAGALATIKDSELFNNLKDSEVLNNLKDADPISAVKESEFVSTVKQRLAETFGPDETPSEKSSLLDPERKTATLGRPKEPQTLSEDLYHEPSYVEDPDEMDHYRNRWIITAFVVIVLLMVAFWAMGQAQASLTDGWQRMFEMLNI